MIRNFAEELNCKPKVTENVEDKDDLENTE